MEEVVVYTCLTNGKDVLKPAPSGVKAFCYTDEYVSPGVVVNGWELLPLHEGSLGLSPRRVARFHKLNSHLLAELEGFVWVLWMDAKVSLKVSVEELVLLMGDCLVGCPLHPVRDCIYEEALVVDQLRLCDSSLISAQVGFLRSEGYPESNGLHDTCLLLRRSSDEVVKFNMNWWFLLRVYSQRDQLGFNYVAWKQGLKVFDVPNSRFLTHQHSKPSTLLT